MRTGTTKDSLFLVVNYCRLRERKPPPRLRAVLAVQGRRVPCGHPACLASNVRCGVSARILTVPSRGTIPLPMTCYGRRMCTGLLFASQVSRVARPAPLSLSCVLGMAGMVRAAAEEIGRRLLLVESLCGSTK